MSQRNEKREALLSKVRNLPHSPGVYRFQNKDGKIIYIGKAKNLRNRVSSYFLAGRGHSYRIEKMVSQISDFAYTVTHSEVEALLLENNLIKNHQPKYNILLKDGKTYPYICVKKERFPRVFSTRTRQNDGSSYYGPYPSSSTMKAILRLIKTLIPLRTCNYHLSDANISAGKFKKCLEFQIGNCLGPCEGLQSEEAYNEGIAQIRHILKGHLGPVIQQVEGKMKEAAEKYEFEKADWYKRQLENLHAYKRKSTVVSDTIRDLEVLTIETEQHLAVVNHFHVMDGAIVQTHSWEVKRKNQEDEAEILAATLTFMAADDDGLGSDIVTNVEVPAELLPEGMSLTIPQRGDKKHLVDLSLKNCKTLLTEKLFKQNFQKRRSMADIMVDELQMALRMEDKPNHIECFDNSNFQGTNPVASCVVFKQGKPSKKDYRHFKIKTVVGPDDFASMEEIVFRRYKRLLDEKEPLPDLILIDGGKGQLNAAANSLRKLDLIGKIHIVGIAKRLEEIYRLGDPVPLHIDKRNNGLKLVQQLRNEAHRFAITFHRDLRSKRPGQRSLLGGIKGIGPKAEQEILKAFKSVKKLKEASQPEREAKIGTHRAALIQQAIKDGVI